MQFATPTVTVTSPVAASPASPRHRRGRAAAVCAAPLRTRPAAFVAAAPPLLLAAAAAALSAAALRALQLQTRFPGLRRAATRLQLKLLRLARPRRRADPLVVTGTGTDTDINVNVVAPSSSDQIESSFEADLADPSLSPADALDRVKRRADAALDAAAADAAAALSPADYQRLAPAQRRAMLERALSLAATAAGSANGNVGTGGTTRPGGVSNSSNSSSNSGVGTVAMTNAGSGGVSGTRGTFASGQAAARAAVRRDARPRRERGVDAFLRVAESVNGRAAALGFTLCLAREVLEPGHPSLFEQVVDVVVPIAQGTPPFLVAVCDRLADLLT